MPQRVGNIPIEPNTKFLFKKTTTQGSVATLNYNNIYNLHATCSSKVGEESLGFPAPASVRAKLPVAIV